MIIQKKSDLLELKKIVSKDKKIIDEMTSMVHSKNSSKSDNSSILSHINLLKQNLKVENEKIPKLIENINLTRVLDNQGNKKIVDQVLEEDEKEKKKHKKNFFEKREEEIKLSKEYKISTSEKSVIRRIEEKKKEEVSKKVGKGPNKYAGIASRLFSDFSRPLVETGKFSGMIDDLLKTNLGILPTVYISIIFLSVLISLIVAFVIFLFFLFFNISTAPPFIIPETNMISKFLEIFWILFIIPIATFVSLYFYPSLERKSLEAGIDQELPFATINMSAIAGSKIEPTNIFNIIISTGEYPYLKKQFIKVMNEINIYGHDLVTSLKNAADYCPSKKLSDLYNSLSTNITSGGDLGEFFDKRSESLLLDYRLERERSTRSSETFIDVYISVVIAAPMILMLLFMMIQVSGLGISLSPIEVSVIMILGVALINFVFLMFLRFRQPSK
ncbi:MAG: type II secretion system F family protein [Candidatus Nanoarchaeia archaeon]